MPKFSTRSFALEWMDDFNSDPGEISVALDELETINMRLGGYAVVLDALDRLDLKPGKVSISDWGCGGGDMLRVIANWAAKQELKAELTGIDASAPVIAYAKKQSSAFPNIRFLQKNVMDESFKPSFDISVASLFCHHFDDQSLVKLIHRMYNSSGSAVIINDLHRHWFAYYAIRLITLLFSRSTMVKNDGPLSVLRAFKRSELEALFKQAGVKHYRIRWRWAFRWQAILYK